MLKVWSAFVGVLLIAGAAHAQTPPPASPPAPTASKPLEIVGKLAVGLRERDSFESPLKVSGGTPPFTWSIVDGALPEGVFLHSRTGLLHGTPERRGDYRFTVQARDANNATVARTFEYSVLYNPSAFGR